ncbi:MAG: carbamate kinase, partial [Acidimicrobiia bacterium]
MNSAQRRAVVAIGGNALIAGPSRLRFADQLSVARRTVQPVADMVADGWQVTVVHGNGPQVGFEVRRSELAAAELPELPLEVSVAQTQGSMGFLLQQALGEALAERRLETQAVTLITRTEVDPDDPAFRAPTKPIGSFLDAGEAEAAREDGWVVIEDAGRGWRRVVASPRPRRIVEAEVVGSLLDDGVVVMAAGGGGIPVVPRPGGGWEGVAAVID